MKRLKVAATKNRSSASPVCFLAAILLIGQDAKPLPRSKAPDGALGRIIGSELVIIRAGQEPRRRQLEVDFLSWAFSPDGRAVIGLARKQIAEGISQYKIVLSGPFGRGTASSAGGFSNVLAISLSPNKHLVALVATNQIAGFRGLQVLDLADPEPARTARELQRAAVMDTYLAWSADSSSLVYSWGGEVRIVELSTGKERRIGQGRMPTWSPDGRWITWIADNNTLIMYQPVSGTRRVVRRPRELRSGAIWAPDSTHFMIDEDWAPQSGERTCLGNSRLVDYSADGVASKLLWNPCGLKPQLFGFIDDWLAWINHD